MFDLLFGKKPKFEDEQALMPYECAYRVPYEDFWEGIWEYFSEESPVMVGGWRVPTHDPDSGKLTAIMAYSSPELFGDETADMRIQKALAEQHGQAQTELRVKITLKAAIRPMQHPTGDGTVIRIAWGMEWTGWVNTDSAFRQKSIVQRHLYKSWTQKFGPPVSLLLPYQSPIGHSEGITYVLRKVESGGKKPSFIVYKNNAQVKSFSSYEQSVVWLFHQLKQFEYKQLWRDETR